MFTILFPSSPKKIKFVVQSYENKETFVIYSPVCFQVINY
jgi:hypothetical protein